MKEYIYIYIVIHKHTTVSICKVLCLWMHLLTKILCNRKINTHGISWAMCAIVYKVVKHLSCPVSMFSAEGHTLSSEFQLSYGKQMPFYNLVPAKYFNFYAFCWICCYLKWLPRRVLECSLLGLLSARRLWYALWENVFV